MDERSKDRGTGATDERSAGRRTRRRWLKRRDDDTRSQRFPLLVVGVVGFWLILLWLVLKAIGA